MVHPVAAGDLEEVTASGFGNATCAGTVCAVTIGCAAAATATETLTSRFPISTHIDSCWSPDLGVSAPPTAAPGGAAATYTTATGIHGAASGFDVCYTAVVWYQTTHDPIPSETSGCSFVEAAATDVAGATSAGSSEACGRGVGECISAGGALVDVVKDEGNPRGGVAVFACSATAPSAAGVAITSCSADSIAAPQLAAPGPVAATAGSLTVVDDASYLVCWSAKALFAGGFVDTSGCGVASTNL